MSADTTAVPSSRIAAQLAAFAHGLEPGMLPAAVVEQAKLLMLDALGIVAGVQTSRDRDGIETSDRNVR